MTLSDAHVRALLDDATEHQYRRTVRALATEVLALRQWVHDLQRGMYINCVYCGHRYGPSDEVPATMADVQALQRAAREAESPHG